MHLAIEAELPIDGWTAESVWNVNLIVSMIISLKLSSQGWARVSEQQGLHNVGEISTEIETKDRPVWVGMCSLLGCEADREYRLDGVTAGGISSSYTSEVISDCARYHGYHTGQSWGHLQDKPLKCRRDGHR